MQPTATSGRNPDQAHQQHRVSTCFVCQIDPLYESIWEYTALKHYIFIQFSGLQQVR